MVALSRFTWVDLPLMLIPGMLLFLFALSWQGYEGQRVMAIWSLVAYLIFLGFYMGTRFLLPGRARVLVATVVVIPAVLSFFAGGISLAAGYAIWVFVSAPLFGILFGAAFVPKRRRWPDSAPVSA